MKKTITILAILVIATISMMGSVFAAETITLSSNQTEKTVLVTLKFNGNPTDGVQFNLKYDSSLLAYDSIDSGALLNDVNSDEENNLQVIVFGTSQTTNTITIKFNVKEGAEGKAEFSISGLKGTTATLENTTTAVTVASTNKPQENPNDQGNTGSTTTPNTDDKNTEQQTNNENNKSESINKEKVGTDGKVITKLPQTGTPAYIGAIAIIALASAVLVVKKIRK